MTNTGVEMILCNLYTTDKDATVACKQLGYSYSKGKIINVRTPKTVKYPFLGVKLR